MSEIIRIFLVDDHTIFRDGLKSLLSQEEGFRVVGEAENGMEFLKKFTGSNADIVLMDISMPEMDGPETVEKALAKFPNLKIITLTSYSDQVYYYKMIKAGVQGFVQKSADSNELEKAIRDVYKGGNYFPQDILRNLIFRIGNKNQEGILNDQIELSKRESEVLYLICQGNTNNEIAEKLFISPKTVDNHRTHLLSKTNTKNTAHLVMFSIKNHLIEI